jgi:hypothetical protein
MTGSEAAAQLRSVGPVAPPADLQDLDSRCNLRTVRPGRTGWVPPGRGDVIRHCRVNIRGVVELVEELPVGKAVGDLASRRHGLISGKNALKPLDLGG